MKTERLPKEILAIRVQPEVKRALEAKARKRDQTLSHFVGRLLERIGLGKRGAP